MRIDVAAAALIRDEGNRILILEQAYAPGWTLPGGLVEPGESPREACEREVHEEIGLVVSATHLICVDWCRRSDGEPIVGFLFDGGRVTTHQVSQLTCRTGEIKSAEFVAAEVAGSRLSTRLGRRLVAVVQAAGPYLEDGKPPFGMA
jgi:8-oxo-dGTP diphosphatase